MMADSICQVSQQSLNPNHVTSASVQETQQRRGALSMISCQQNSRTTCKFKHPIGVLLFEHPLAVTIAKIRTVKKVFWREFTLYQDNISRIRRTFQGNKFPDMMKSGCLQLCMLVRSCPILPEKKTCNSKNDYDYSKISFRLNFKR